MENTLTNLLEAIFELCLVIPERLIESQGLRNALGILALFEVGLGGLTLFDLLFSNHSYIPPSILEPASVMLFVFGILLCGISIMVGFWESVTDGLVWW